MLQVDALQGKSLNDMDLASRKAEKASLRRCDAAGWLRKMVGVVTARDLPDHPSEQDFRLGLRIEAPSGSVIVPDGATLSAFQYFENVRNFLNSAEELGIPVFEASDLEQGGNSSRIVNCVLALKSYYEWKERGGKGVWKFCGTWKPHSASKQFFRKSSDDLFVNSLSRNSSVVEHNGQDFNEMGTSDALHLFVRELLSDNKQDDIPMVIGSMLSKVMEEFEQRLKQVQDVWMSQVPTSIKLSSLRDKDVTSSCLSSEALNIMKDESWSKNDSRDGNPKQHSSKRQDLIDYHQRSIQELKSTLHSTKEDLHLLHMKYQEELHYLGKHLNGLAGAASRYQKVLEENRKLYNQVQDLKEALDGQTISVITPAKNGKGKKLFTLNKVFGPSASQEDVFSDTQPLIRSVLDGYNVCIFAYGQTGSGKTYTMTGPQELTPESLGVNYRALSDLFFISHQRKDSMSYDVFVQMIEIYNEQVRDLLVSDEIRNSSHNGINVPSANILPVSSTSDVINLMNIGLKNRAVGSTSMNERSICSCVTVHVQGRNLTSGSITCGSMHLVDLAGSERADKTDAVGDRLKESQHINRSLSALGDVIASLAQKQSHIPYRNSKLTQLLQDSLGGQAKTLMFIHISPEPDALGETVSMLKFAERVSTVELGAARANKDSPDVRELKEQIASLKAALSRKERVEDGATNGYFTYSPAPSWPSIGDVGKGEGQTESLAVLSMHRFDGEDLMASPISLVSTEEERSVSGDWVDKVMMKSHLGDQSPEMCRRYTSKVYPQHSLSKIAVLRRDNSLGRNQFDGAAELEYTEVEASDESVYQWQTNGAKQNGGGGTKAKTPTQNQRHMKSTEIRSLIPQPPTREVANGSNSPSVKNRKKPAVVDGKRKPASTVQK
ncbi:hypothetical protein SASPL_108302 [Salvia splendens]|uniref:Kinesin-like protein n=1 Tax=Salvia splendens TaxID=180675 RepID=A0A8X8YF38_SALSN|nr:hypothetical protein SASPL_108302 [Salvia splendens]